MVRIFQDKKSGEFVVQTTCLDADSFVSDLAEAVAEAVRKAPSSEADVVALGVLTNAMPIAFKLSGYKADNVAEQRTLICGVASPSSSDLLVTVGR